MKKEITVSELGEKKIISDIIAPICKNTKVPIGIGDDTAMVNIPHGKNLLISTDKIPEDLLAIQLGIMDPFHHGRYLATVNISDIAAMGGEPIGLLATLALPNDFKIDYLIKFYEGFVNGANEWDVPIIGGDLGWGSATCLSATIIGVVEPEKVLQRNTAEEDDNLFVTGPIGGFNTALLYFIEAKPKGFKLSLKDENYLKMKLISPFANVEKGKLLSESGVCSSCMDITDGVASTIFELSSYSKTKFIVKEDCLPIHHTTNKIANYLNIEPWEIVFGVGLDLELMGTISCAENNLPNKLREQIFIIGEAYIGEKNLLITRDKRKVSIPPSGWQHFTGDAMELVKTFIQKK